MSPTNVYYQTLRRPCRFPTILVQVQSMRLSSRKGSDKMDMIKRTLEEDGDNEGGIVEKFA